METEHNPFEQVRQLLALKKHEQPPPRFFQDFSGQVIARLRALESARSITWRQRLGLDFDLKPAMIGACGVVVSGLLLVGVLTSMGESQPASQLSSATETSVLLAVPTTGPALPGGWNISPIDRPDSLASSTAPVGGASAPDSPFRQLVPHAQPVSFSLGGN